MYKTIVVHVDQGAACPPRVDAAARLALAHDAHLVGSALTDLAAFTFPLTAMDAGAPPVVFPIDELRANADRALDRFEQQVRAAGLASFERRRLDDDAGVGLCLQARYADLLVIGQSGERKPGPYALPDASSYVVLNSPRPVLVVPAHAASAGVGNAVTVAWNGSAQAVRAIASAIPLLRRAARVVLLVLLDDDAAQLHGEQPGADMALYLARHGVRVEVDARASSDDQGEQLLSCAASTGSDLIVMGAFGHSRLREFVLGGVTRTVLRSSPIAAWMVH